MKHHIKQITSLDYISTCLDCSPLSLIFKEGLIKMYHYEVLRKKFKTLASLSPLDYNCYIHLTSGSVKMQVLNDEENIYAPAIVSLNNETVNALLETSEDVSGTLLIIEKTPLNTAFIKPFFLRLPDVNPVIELTDGSSNWVSAMCDLLFAELNGKTADPEVSNVLIQSFLFKVISLIGKEYGLPRSTLVSIEFIQLINLNFMNCKDFYFYLQKESVNEEYIYRCVRKELNKNARNLITELWVLQGQLMLQDVKLSILKIAETLSFTDVSYFGRVFRKYTGMSPTEYREKITQEMSGYLEDLD